jgi:hypothetical protein
MLDKLDRRKEEIKMKLKIGDKVKIKKDTLPDFIGMSGTVIEIYKYDKDFPYNYLIKFDTSECLPIIWDVVVTRRLYKDGELEKRRS